MIRKPPVAVAGAAITANRCLSEALAKREAQSGVHECCGLAGSWGADEHVPGQFIQVLTTPAAGTAPSLTPLLQNRDGFFKPLTQNGHFLLSRAGRRGRGSASLHESFGELGVLTLCLDLSPGPPADIQNEYGGNRDRADQR